jgi:hypothetical protein
VAVTLKWTTPCLETTCYSKVPVLTKPQAQINNDLQAMVVFGDDSVVGSATPLGRVTCTTTPGSYVGYGDLDGVLIIDQLDASLTYTVNCTIVDANNVSSLAVASDMFAAATIPTTKPTLVAMISTTSGVVAKFVPLLSSSGSIDYSVTSYVLTFTTGTTANQFEVAMSSLTCGYNTDRGSMECTVLLSLPTEGPYGMTVAAKNIAGTGPISTESTSIGDAPWPLLQWKANCPQNTCSGKLPSITSAPTVRCYAENTITIAIDKSNLVVGSAAPYGTLSCSAYAVTGGVTSNTATASGSVQYSASGDYGYMMTLSADSGLNAETEYVTDCTLQDAGGISSAPSAQSDPMYPTTKPPTPVAGSASKTALSGGKYAAVVILSGLDARNQYQGTDQIQVKCTEKGNTDPATNFETTTPLADTLTTSTQTITINALLPDVAYVFVCTSINEDGETSTETSSDISITQSSSASQTEPNAPTISSVARDGSTGVVTVNVTPDVSVTDTDVTKYTCTATNNCGGANVETSVSLSSKTHATETVLFENPKELIVGVEYSISCTTTTDNLESDPSSPSILRLNDAVSENVNLLNTAPTLTAGVSETLSIVWAAPAASGQKRSASRCCWRCCAVGMTHTQGKPR